MFNRANVTPAGRPTSAGSTLPRALASTSVAIAAASSVTSHNISQHISAMDLFNTLADSLHQSDISNIDLQTGNLHRGKSVLEECESTTDASSIARLVETYQPDILAYLVLGRRTLPKIVSATNTYGHHYPEMLYRKDRVELCYHNLLNILLFNPDTGAFDLSMLPTRIRPHKSLVDFYKLSQIHINDLNGTTVANAFNDLVSGHPFLNYVNKDSLLHISSTMTDFITLLNYLFGTSANSFEELSIAFSDERRQINFTSYAYHSKTLHQIEMDVTANGKHEYLIFSHDSIGAKFNAPMFDDTSSLTTKIKFDNIVTHLATDIDKHHRLLTQLLMSCDNKSRMSHLSRLLPSVTNERTLAFFAAHTRVALENTLPDKTSFHFTVLNVLKKALTFLDDLANMKASLLTLLTFPNVIALAAHQNEHAVLTMAKDIGFHYVNDEQLPAIHQVNNDTTLWLVLGLGANINDLNQSENNALHALADEGVSISVPIVEQLISHGIDVNKQNSRGKTPLHVLAQVSYFQPLEAEARVEIIKCLVENGADTTLRDENDKKASDYASQASVVDFFKTLETAPNAPEPARMRR